MPLVAVVLKAASVCHVLSNGETRGWLLAGCALSARCGIRQGSGLPLALVVIGGPKVVC